MDPPMNQPGSAILVDFEITGRPEPQSDEALWRNSPPNQHAKWVYKSCTDEFCEYMWISRSIKTILHIWDNHNITWETIHNLSNKWSNVVWTIINHPPSHHHKLLIYIYINHSQTNLWFMTLFYPHVPYFPYSFLNIVYLLFHPHYTLPSGK